MLFVLSVALVKEDLPKMSRGLGGGGWAGLAGMAWYGVECVVCFLFWWHREMKMPPT